MNLLRGPWIGKLAKSRWFPLTLQVVTLAVFVLLVVGGLGVTTEDAGFAKVLRNTNLANLIVWSYWWPLIIIAAVLLGRAWCTVCPVELLTFLSSKVGLRRSVPEWFRSGWLMTLFYVTILLIGVHTLAIHRIPHRMALYLLTLVIVAVAVSVVFHKRAFCSYVCPIGHLLGLYAMASPFEWRADDLERCRTCKTKDCVTKSNWHRLAGRSCTSNLYPATMKDNRECLLCTQCLKACPYDNIRLSVRRPFSDFVRGVDLKPALVAFVLVVSGFVVYEILSEWSPSKAVLTWFPHHLTTAFGMEGALAGLISAGIMFVAFPGILFLAVGVAAGPLSGESFSRAVKTFAVLLLPTMAGAHVIKSLLKMVSRLPYWSHALSDPKGVVSAQGILDKSIVLDKQVIEALTPLVSYLSIGILLFSLVGTIAIFRKSSTLKGLRPGAKVFLLAGTLLYWGTFLITLVLWRF